MRKSYLKLNTRKHHILEIFVHLISGLQDLGDVEIDTPSVYYPKVNVVIKCFAKHKDGLCKAL